MRLICILIWALMGTLPIFGQGFSFHTYYSPEDYAIDGEKGGPQNWTFALAPDRSVLIGNGNGLLRFNGNNWEFTHVGDIGRVVAIHPSETGEILASISSDFGFVVPDSLNRISYSSVADRFYEPQQERPYVWNIYDFNPSYYLQHLNGIAIYNKQADQYQDYPLTKGNNFVSSVRMGDSLLVSDERGLWIFRDSLYHKIPDSEAFGNQTLLFAIPVGENYLVGTVTDIPVYQTSGLWWYDGNEMTPFEGEVNSYLHKNILYDATLVNSESIALATLYGGVIFMNPRGGIQKILTERTGLHTNTVLDLYLDPEETLWMGLNVGIQKMSLRDKIEYFDEWAGIQGSVKDILSIGEQLYVVTQTDNLYKRVLLQPESIYIFEKLNSTGPIDGFFSWQDQAYYYSREGIFSLDEKGTTRRLYNKPIQALVRNPDENGERIFLTSTGLVRYDGSTFQEEELTQDLEAGYAIEFQGDIYFTQGPKNDTNRLSVIKGQKIQPLTIDYDSSGIFSIIYLNVLNNKLFIGTNGTKDNAGLYEYDPDKERFIKSTLAKDYEDLTNKQVFNFEQCSEDEIWFTVNKKFVKAVLSQGEWMVHESPYQWISKDVHYAMECTDDGIWLGSTNTMTFIPSDEWNYESPYPTNISGIYVGRDSLIYGGFEDPKEEIILPYQDNELRFMYAAASYISPEDNWYQVMLEGFDPAWSSWSKEIQKDYTNIPEGRYTFKVRSKNVYQTAGMMDTFSFVILPPWYRTWWAYLIYTVLIMATLYGIYRIRLNQVMRVQRIRNRIASDLHDEVSATLSSISYFAEAIQTNVAKDNQRFIDLIANSAGDAKEKITDIVWAINPEHDDWQQFLAKCRRFTSDLMESKGIKYSLKIDDNIPAKLDMQLRQHLWLIFKEMVTNAARHSQANQLDVIMRFKNGFLEVVVQDDGKGMDVDEVRKGNGLINIQKRTDLIQGEIHLRSSEGFGTRWNLKVPV